MTTTTGSWQRGTPLPDGPDRYRSRHASGLLLEHVYFWERERAERVCMTQPFDGGKVRELTYRQAVGEARRMAAHLRSLALPPGSSVGLLGRNSAHWILADLAIWMAGHVSVPIYPTLHAASVRQILEHSAARLLFVGKLDAWEAMKGGVDPALPVIRLPLAPDVGGDAWDDLIARSAPIADDPVRGPDEVATIVYTSGSTGVPKGVEATFGAMTRSGIAQQRHLEAIGFHASPDDRFLSYLPLAHVYERSVVEVAWCLGSGQVFFAESLLTFAADLRRARPTWFVSVPRLWQQFYLGVTARIPARRLDLMLRLPVVGRVVRRKVLEGLGLDGVQLAVSGSAPIAPALIDWYRRLGLELLEGYGMTEDFACSHFSPPGKTRSGYVGLPLPGVECRISDEGEVLVKSPGALRGYHREAELTRASFTDDGFFRTGDRGEHDAEGRLRITGRVKELFKSGKGKYVAPVPIENLLMEHPRIELACVAGVGQPQPHAMLVLSEAARADVARGGPAAVEAELEALLARVNGRLEGHEELAFLAVVGEAWTIEGGLLTPTLKLKRASIEERYRAEVEGWYQQRRRVVWHRPG